MESSRAEAARLFGGRLFNAVFHGEVRSCLRSSIEDAQRQNAGLRIRLRLTNAPELTDLPWEFLYNPTLNRLRTQALAYGRCALFSPPKAHRT